MEQLSDSRLVGLAKTGNVEAFAELARRYQMKVFGTVRSLTRNRSDADDLTQEAFMHAFRALKGFKQEAGFHTWIHRIAVNLTLNHLKKAAPAKKLRRELDSEQKGACGARNPGGADASPERLSLNKELRLRLRAAIDALPLGYRLAFVLVEIQGMTHRQASCVLRCTENTVSWRMHRARKMLQSRLRPYLEGGAS